MDPPLEMLLAPHVGIELLYSFIIILCSLMIYHGTKELYDLSSHKGIKYFRQSFLFFAGAYFLRSFIKFIIMYFNIREIREFSPMFFGSVTLFLFIYLSSLAMFYLLYSIMWKKWNGNSNKIYIFHVIALLISFVSIYFNNPVIYLLLNIFLFLFILITVYLTHRNSKTKLKKNHLFVIYLLLFAFWILNVIDILIPEFLQMFQLLIYLISSGIFLLILYRVIKKSGN
jgi:hypothetical protein